MPRVQVKDAAGTTVGVGAAVDAAGNYRQVTGGAAASARTQVAAATTAAVLLPANADRVGFTVYNTSTNMLYLNLANVAPTANNYTVRVAPDGYYEAPYGYTGAVQGVWGGTGGNANVTELTV